MSWGSSSSIGLVKGKICSSFQPQRLKGMKPTRDTPAFRKKYRKNIKILLKELLMRWIKTIIKILLPQSI